MNWHASKCANDHQGLVIDSDTGASFHIMDKGSPDDTPEEFQWQMYGVADIGYGGEHGYMCLPEMLGAGAELDFRFTPKRITT